MNVLRRDIHRLLPFAALAICAVWVLLALVTWRDLASGPRVGSPWTTYGYGQALLFGTSVQVVPVLATLLWNIAAALIGYVLVVRPVFGGARYTTPIWQVVAGAIPGMLIMIAAVRVTTLLLPNAVAPALLLVCGLSSALAALYYIVPKGGPGAAASTSISCHSVWPPVAALVVALVFSVQVDRAHVAAEGSVWFITEVFLSAQHGIGTTGNWPLISQHYDEAAFIYPVVYGLVQADHAASATLTAMYWVLLACGRLSMLALTYLAVRALGLDRLSGLVLVAFFCAASLSLNPVASRVLFDSLSPLGYTLHVSRFLVPVLPLLLMAGYAAAVPSVTWRAAVTAAAMGLGLSSMTIHAVLVLLWAGAVLAMVLLAPRAGRAEGVWRAAMIASLGLIAAFTLSYGVRALPDVAAVAVLLAATLAAVVLMLGAAWREYTPQPEMREDPIAAGWLLLSLAAGYVAGLLLLGNILVPRTLPVLAGAWPWSQATILERFYSTLAAASTDIARSPHCDGGYYWAFRWLTGHCGSLAMFARTYGLAMVVMTGVVAWWLLRRPHAEAVPDRTLTPWLWSIVIAFLAMPVGFVLFDFVPSIGAAAEWEKQLSVWLRSRLLEPWFYSGSFLALALFLRLSAVFERRLLQSIMLVGVALFALSPLELPAQMIANIAYLLDTAVAR